MPFPQDVLAQNECVVLHLHPHWKTAVRPVVILAVAMTALAVTWIFLPDNEGGRTGVLVTTMVCLIAALWKVLWPVLVWRATHYVLTDQRVLVQHGVLSRDRRDIPLARIDDHAMSQRLLDRLLGCGMLTIESAGDRGPAVLAAVPDVERVQTVLYELVEADRARHAASDDDEPRAGAGKPARDGDPDRG